MLNIWSWCLDLIFPPHSSVQALAGISPTHFKSHYRLRHKCDCQTLSDYNDQLIRAAITANKFHNSKLAAALLATLLDTWTEKEVVNNIIFVPVPLSLKRYRDRGYNQVTRILEQMKKPSYPIVELLQKTRNTPPQTTLKRAERLKNLDQVFIYLPSPISLENCHIVLVDDVLTTGTTLKAARAALAPHLPRSTNLTCLALAH